MTPGLALAATLHESSPDSEIVIVGRDGGVAERLVEQSAFRLATVKIGGVDVQHPATLARFTAELPRAIRAMKRLFDEVKPDVVVGTSGYVCVPVILAAQSRKIPTVLLEQNALPGRATRLLARWVNAIATSYPTTRQHLHARYVVYTGNPVRPEVVARRGISERSFCDRLLVMGGSQGARRINSAIIGSIATLLDRYPTLTVTHQCGVADSDRVVARWKELAPEYQKRYHVAPFFDDIAKEIEDSDLVVMRAGGSSLAECSTVGRPMVLVPYPYAGGHQLFNTTMYVNRGAAIMIPDEECTPDRMLEEAGGIIGDVSRWKAMMDASFGLGKPDAAREVISLIEKSCRMTERIPEGV